MEATESHETIRHKLDQLRGRWRRTYIAEGGLLFLAVILAVLLACLSVEGWRPAPDPMRADPVRWILLSVLGATALAGIGWLVLKRVATDRTDEDLALQAERTFPETDNGFINAIRLGKEKIIPSPAMVAELVKESAQRVAPLDVRRIVSGRRVTRYSGVTAFLALVLVVVLVLFPGRMRNAFARIARPGRHIPKVGRVVITDVAPSEDTILVSGDPLHVKATIERTALPDVAGAFHYLFEGGKPKSLRMHGDETRERFEAVLRDVRVPLSYYLDIGGTETRLFRVTIVEKPTVTNIWRRYHYPPYTREPEREEDDGDGTISVLEGTVVELKVRTNKPVVRASLTRRHGEEETVEDLQIGLGGRALALPRSFRVTADGEYAVQLTDEYGNENTDRATRVIRCQSDAPPKVTLAQPGRDVVTPPGSAVDVVVRGTDRYGISRAQLVAWRQGAEDKPWVLKEWPPPSPGAGAPARAQPGTVATGPGLGTSVSLHFKWELDPAKHKHGNVLRYKAIMWDNNSVSKSGPGRGESAEFQLRIEDAKASREKTREKYQDWRIKLQQLLDEQKTLRKETREIRGKGKPDEKR